MTAITWMLITYLLVVGLGWAVWWELQHGRIIRRPGTNGLTIERGRQPVSFWATIAGQTLGVLVVAFFAVVLTWAVLHPNSN